MRLKDYRYLAYLNQKLNELEEIQADIDKARRKYFDVSEIQLKLDRRQEDLDRLKKGMAADRLKVLSEVHNPN